MADLSLKVLIETVLKGQGITATKEQIQALTEATEKQTTAGEALNVTSAQIVEQYDALTKAAKETAPAMKVVGDEAEELVKQFAEANAKSREWADSLKGLTNDQLLEVEEKLRRQIERQKELGQSTDDLKLKLEQAYGTRTTSQLSDGLGKVGKAGMDLNRVGNELQGGLSTTQRTMSGLNTTAQGLARGGILGLTQAASGLGNVLKAVATGPIGLILIPALAATGAAMVALRTIASSTSREINRMWEQAESRAAKSRETVAALNAAITQSAEAQSASIAQLTARYDELIGRMDAAAARNAAINEDQRALKLAQAGSPEARAALEAQFVDDDLTNRELGAELRQRNAQEQLTGLRQQLSDAEAIASNAERAAADALSATDGMGGRTDALAMDTRRQAQDTRKAADEAIKKRDELLAQVTAAMERAEAEIDAAALELERVAIQRETAAINRAKAAKAVIGAAALSTLVKNPSDGPAAPISKDFADALEQTGLPNVQENSKRDISSALGTSSGGVIQFGDQQIRVAGTEAAAATKKAATETIAAFNTISRENQNLAAAIRTNKEKGR